MIETVYCVCCVLKFIHLKLDIELKFPAQGWSAWGGKI